ncbi:hypothetical protein APA_945 [Pseudanabaena sp. lw0831]|nr:hypothetical protein APA_945 [Pseudanabaena sp. lw0831]
MKALNINTSLLFSSELHPTGVKDQLMFNLCKQVGANTYFSGALGRNYLNHKLFEESDIQVVYQNYHHPEYYQRQGKVFEPLICPSLIFFLTMDLKA